MSVIDDTVHKLKPRLVRSTILQVTDRSTLEGHLAENRIYATLQREFVRLNMSLRAYSTSQKYQICPRKRKKF